MNLRHRLYLALGAPVLLLTLGGAAALWRVNHLQGQIARSFEASQAGAALVERLDLTARQAAQIIQASAKGGAWSTDADALKSAFLATCASYRETSPDAPIDEIEGLFKDAFGKGEAYARAMASRDYAAAGSGAAAFKASQAAVEKQLEALRERERVQIQGQMDGLDRAVKRLALAFGLLILLCLAAAAAAAAALERSLILPMARMVEAAGRVARGDLTGADIPAARGDEIGRLAGAFNEMLAQLRGIARRMQETSGKLVGSARSLTEIAGRSRSEMAQLSSAITQISSGAGEVARMAEVALDGARVSTDAAAKGREGVRLLTESMDNIRRAVAGEADSTQALVRSSNQIREVVALISSFADQTNLLSLNAAIEAARAGAAGRGFAVVAEEVRKLAESSAQGAREIEGITKQVLGQTEEITGMVSSGAREVEKGHKITDENARQFHAVLGGFETVAKQIQSVAAANEEIATSTRVASAGAQKNAGEMDRLASDAATLLEVSGLLKELADRFRLPEGGGPAPSA